MDMDLTPIMVLFAAAWSFAVMLMSTIDTHRIPRRIYNPLYLVQWAACVELILAVASESGPGPVVLSFLSILITVFALREARWDYL